MTDIIRLSGLKIKGKHDPKPQPQVNKADFFKKAFVYVDCCLSTVFLLARQTLKVEKYGNVTISMTAGANNLSKDIRIPRCASTSKQASSNAGSKTISRFFLLSSMSAWEIPVQ